MSPTSDSTKTVEIFYAYAPEDEALCNELAKHLKLLKRQEVITSWYDREIIAGQEWAHEINTHLNTAQIILLLVSADFMASDYCYSTEMQHILERQKSGEARVIPIILRPVDWREAPFGKLAVLPRNAKPITSWSNRDEAFSDITKEIRRVVEVLREPKHSSSVSSKLATLAEEPPLSPVWNVPYPRNPFFTGREDTLKDLYETLIKGKLPAPALPQALSGPSGIGKTQIAIEYAYRYSRNYQAILWVRADSRTTLTSDFVTIAGLLNLPEKDVQDQNRAVAAVKRWMEDHTDWLLILNNIDNLSAVSDFIPSTSRGHILLTVQRPTTGRLAQQVKIDRMTSEEGALFLLRRANLIASTASLTNASDSDRTTAMELSEVMDGFPLALDLAGAYIEQTNYGLPGYLTRYWRKRGWRSNPDSDSHEPLTTAWALTFEKIKETDSAPMELLHLFAFLYPNAIPQEIIAEGFADFSQTFQSATTDPSKLDSALNELLKFALVHRASSAQRLTIHPLLQAILKDGMDEDTQREWIRLTIWAINRVFPHVEFLTWEPCEQYLPFAQVCAECIKQWNIADPEAVQLLHRVAYYLKERGHYSQGESLGLLALDIQEQTLGYNHPNVTQSLNNLAEIYLAQGKYVQAEPLYQRALTICIRVLGSTHPDVATSFNNLATLYKEQGKYVEAESFFKQALNIRETTLGPDHSDVATSLNNLALLYCAQGKYDEAKLLLLRALSIRETTLGPDHSDVATSLNNLATLYSDQGRHNKAEPLFRRALAIDEKVHGQNHPNLARDLNNLGGVLEARGDLTDAQTHYEQALSIDEKIYGPSHPNVAGDINNLGSVLRKLGDLSEAQILYEQALNIDEQAYGLNHPSIAIRLNNLGRILQERGNLEGAQKHYERALTIVETAYGKNHPNAASIINNLASVLQTMGNTKDAQALYERALTVAVTTYGPTHPNVGNIANNLGSVLQETGDIAGAQVYRKQADQIFSEHSAENHP